MKALMILMTFFLIACSGQEQKAVSQTTPTTQTKAPQKRAAAPTANGRNIAPSTGGYPTPEAIAEVENNIPPRGGAADFTITVKGAPPGRADLIGFYAEENYLADTTSRSANGVMRFTNPEGYPQGLFYVKFADQRYLQVMLGEDQKFSLETTAANPDGDMKIEGSDENSAFFENLAFEKVGNQQLQAVNAKITAAQEGTEAYKAAKAEQNALLDRRDQELQAIFKKYPNTLFEKFKRAGANPRVRDDVPREQLAYYYRQEFWNDVDFSDRRLIRTPVIKNKLARFFEELTPQNQDSILSSAYLLTDKTLEHPEYFKYIANWIVKKYEPTKCTLMDPEKVHVKMLQKYFNQDRAFWADSLTIYGLQQRASEMQNSLIWEKGPNVISKDLSGKTHNLFDNDEDYVIVYMFAPSCEHCQEETPKLVKWYNEQKAQGKSRDVYAIALDSNVDDPNELANYIKKNNIPFPVIWDPTSRSIYKTYYVDITPEIYVLNPDRYIVGKNLKTFQIDTMINRDLANPLRD
jgi:thiol-disulfide isomerase/thioredoxin